MLTDQEVKDIKKLIKKALCCINNDMYLFQVGIPDSGHIHYAALSKEEAQELIHETRNNVPVADPSQPSVVITTESNGNPGDEHLHDLTIFFDYVNHTFIVTDISNNESYNHEAHLIGSVLNDTGYVDFTFSGNTFPEEVVILNSTSLNYIAATVTTSGLQTFVITFPSLSDFILNKRNTQIIGPNYDNELTYVYFPGDNTVEISHDALGAFEGVFTIRIWTEMLASVI